MARLLARVSLLTAAVLAAVPAGSIWTALDAYVTKIAPPATTTPPTN